MTDRRRLAAQFAGRMSMAMIGSNVLGALVVFVYLVFIIPDRPGATAAAEVMNVAVAGGYLLLALLLGTIGSVLAQRRLLRWLRAGHVVGPEDRRTTLRLPGRLVRLYGLLWFVAVVVFATINLPLSAAGSADIAVTIAAGGATTCALCYLLAERLVRPLLAESMAGVSEAPPVVLGVRRRLLLSWGLGTGIPLAGIALAVLPDSEAQPPGPLPVLFLCAVGLLVGYLAVDVAARSVSEPVGAMAQALREVGRGRLDIGVAVDDVSEVGQLQSGFNAMVGGLRERAQLRDLFGRQVGTDVARLALERGVRLGGERRHVAVLYVDVIGSTRLAVDNEPEDVVAHLNAFFGVVVDVVGRHGGWVNKFEGDAALCIFGAPVERPDAPASALAAGRALCKELAPLEVQAAIGVCAGPVVAGNVGTESRFEYTVIGDPVNTAARLAELARSIPGHLVADGGVVAAAGEEAEQWEQTDEVVLRGRTTPTRLAVPRTS